MDRLWFKALGKVHRWTIRQGQAHCLRQKQRRFKRLMVLADGQPHEKSGRQRVPSGWLPVMEPVYRVGAGPVPSRLPCCPPLPLPLP
jgi:hypothetical protein